MLHQVLYPLVQLVLITLNVCLIIAFKENAIHNVFIKEHLGQIYAIVKIILLVIHKIVLEISANLNVMFQRIQLQN